MFHMKLSTDVEIFYINQTFYIAIYFNELGWLQRYGFYAIFLSTIYPHQNIFLFSIS